MGRKAKLRRKRKRASKRIKGRNHFYKDYRMASHSEVKFAQKCDRQRITWDYEPETFPWIPPPAKYTPDFKITCSNGKIFYVEYKGYLRNSDKRKMIEVKKQHPDLDVRFVFESATKPVAGAKKRKDGTKLSHKEWAEKQGFRWSEGFIPKEWLRGK